MTSKVRSSTFCIDDYDVVGFDLDGCLLKYKWNPFLKLLHKYVVAYLTKVKHYDSQLLQTFDKGWKEVMFRGFFVDTKRGNLLWVLEDGTVQRAFHGKVVMSHDQIGNIYLQARLPVLEQILKNFVSTDEYHLIDNYFEGPLVMIFCELVSAIDNKSLDTGITYQQVWNDIFSGYIDFFQPHASGSSPGFNEVSVKPALYGNPCSRHLKDWLKQLKAAKKYVFLMTSSTVSFAKGVLQYIIGEDYNDYFDFGIGQARKPSFFHYHHNFVDVDDVQAVVTKFEAKKWYEFGCLDVFNEHLEAFTGITNPKVLYIGDGLKNDVFPANRVAHWGALLILEGMEVEGCDSEETTSQKIVGEDETCYVGNNPVWGSFFITNGKETVFARVVRESCDIAIPWLDYITDLPLDYRFPRFDPDSHTLGYYPPLHIMKTIN